MNYQGIKLNNHFIATNKNDSPFFLKKRQIFSIECACLNISLDIKIFALLTADLESKEISAMPNDMCAPVSIISTGAIPEYLS